MTSILAVAIFWMGISSVAYVLAGYPLLISILAWFRREPPVRQTECPRVTLLIAAYNEQEVIARKLDNSLALEYPSGKLQILVAADGSTDRTAEIVAGYADRGVVLSYCPERRGKMAAIDRAMRQTEGTIVVFSDANNMYSPNAILDLVQPFTDPRVGAVSGAKQIVQDGDALAASENLYWRYESFLKRQEARFGTCVAVAGEILAIRRNLYRSPPREIVNDDFYIAMSIVRDGFRIAYEPRALSFETASPSAADERARRARIIAGRYQAMAMAPSYLTWRHPIVAWQIVSHKLLRPLIPLALLGVLLANLWLVLWPLSAAWPSGFWTLAPPFGGALLGLQLMFYLIGVAGTWIGKAGLVGRLVYLPSFLLSSNWATLVGLVRYFRSSQSAAWDRVARRPLKEAS